MKSPNYISTLFQTIHLQGKSLKSLASLVIPLILLTPAFASAQASATSVAATTTQQAITVANINLSNITILSQESGKIRIALDVVNSGDTAQSDIRYGVNLIKTTGKGQVIVDTFVANETLAVGAKKVLHKEFVYNAPSALSGSYDLWVISRTTSGLMLGLGSAGTIALSGAAEYLSIIPESCFLKVVGDDHKYTLLQGVDVKKDETLALSCMVQSHFSRTVSVYPSFETYERTDSGTLMNMTYPPVADITFGSNEDKEITIILPKPEKPQAYDIGVTLIEKTRNTPVSGKIIAHYVLRGASATIQNASFDSVTYQKGGIITMKLFWTPSADSFPGSRVGKGTEIPGVVVNMDVRDENGNVCTAPVSKRITADETEIMLTAAATRLCVFPQATISLLDEAGDILDTRTFASAESRVATTTPSVSPFSTAQTLLLGATILAFLVGLFFVIRKLLTSKRIPTANVIKPLLFVVLLSSGFFTGARNAEALTINDWHQGIANIVFTVNTNKTSYAPGENITLSGSIYVDGCANILAFYNRIVGILNGSTAIITSGEEGGTQTIYGSAQLTAPTTPGTYYINISGCSTQPSWLFNVCLGFKGPGSSTFFGPIPYVSGSIPITVVSPAPPAPTGLSVSCNAAGTQATLSWSSAPGATEYEPRVQTSGGGCPAGWTLWTDGTTCYINGYHGTSVTFSTTPGVGHPWWVHSGVPIDWSKVSSSWFSCTPPAASCTLPWGGTIASGQSTTAYQTPSVVSPQTCSSVAQTRTCTNGSLSGSFTYPSCSVSAASCNLPWGGTIASGVSVTAFLNPTVVAPATCASDPAQTRTCTNGSLSGSYTNQNCTALNPTATISASPTRVQSGNSTKLSWSTTDVTSCTVKGTNGFSRTSTSGTNIDSGTITSQATFTISCDGAAASASVRVNVVPQYQEF